ncbi:EamA family transporter [Persicitalea jodogahamensis]|uniref:Drug/metabolite exporter YedA n=1 Tax=Persicitalea jodogahamensis TaxID=402147 RepID=A0A8J3D729_9BACT|nr:EamA family transporter [Persicitalea jodogahamensis]GHB61128.1 drug/metabolite exporter YedA [Persicitalea jodogahamensis]
MALVSLSDDKFRLENSGEAELSKVTPQRTKLVLNLISVYILWGSTYLFMHFMTERMPPLYMAGCRLLTAGLILYPFARFTGHARPNKQEWLAAGLIGILLLSVANGGMTVAVHYIPTGVAALLAGMLPLFIVILNWLTFSKVRPTKLVMAGLAVGLVGIALLVKPGGFRTTTTESWVGIGLIMVCNLAWATGTLLSGRMKLPTQMVSIAVQMLVGGGLLLLVSLVVEPVTLTSIGQAPTKAIGALIYLIIFGSLIGFSSFSWLARNAPPQILSTYAYVNPVVAMLLGWAFAGEALTGQSLVSALIILAGVVLISFGKRRG